MSEASVRDPGPEEEALIALLLDANRNRRLIERVPEPLLPRDEGAAYRVANAVAARLGMDVGGWKIGATAANNLHDLGASRPIIGRVARSGILRSPVRLRFDALMTPVQECEFAFELAEDLGSRETPWTAADLVPRIRALFPAIEVGERRLSRAHPVPILMLIADNSAAGHLVLGAPAEDWQSRDLAAAAVSLSIDGERRAGGFGRDVLGHPLQALAWMANEGALAGRPLKRGDIVSTGSCTGMVPVAPGTTSRADFGPFGSVEVSFGRIAGS
jgi:2-oxo-hept-3-ene-1,7-dioate hydratase